MWITTQSDLIRRVLSPALGLWLRSLLEAVETLEIKIQGHDRQILKGYIPGVSIVSCRAIYQGLHLGEVHLKAENIRINIGQIIRGKPFRLLEPIQVSGQLHIEEEDLNQSISSFILSNAFTDLLIYLLEYNGIPNPKQILENYSITWENVRLNDHEFMIGGTISDRSSTIFPLTLCAGLELVEGHTLRIEPKQIDIAPEFPHLDLNPFEIDLGTEVHLEQLRLEEGHLTCSGCAIVSN
ncbi:conserved hypothetical protein [Gloeothece citriformis PCC 7424]|uniref:DUF2993 domain-containing protein n=1 Tax=Gloeothece citriformis (strain PCC 7424) TaxID=65393 RepID=B7KGC4_GLOC7|nr:DUF2993 domain-containing protein [Gloeothece citriformis]ACK70595.1 conserved hypothetical protein [Gloeothece citriformis PCC 7424]